MSLVRVSKLGWVVVLVSGASALGCRVQTGPVNNDGSRPPPGSPPSGASPAGGDNCGGIAGLKCPVGMYCAFTVEQKCGAGDAMGTCKSRPEICTEQYQPVCGCDGKQYGNACDAARAGMALQSNTDCPK